MALAPAAARTKPSLIVADDSDEDVSRPARQLSSYAERATKTFGQRAREAIGAESERQANVVESEDIIRGAPGGGMEMSFIPSGKADDDVVRDKKAERKKAKAKTEAGQFGAGLENRRAEKDDAVLEGEEGAGRVKLRKPMRSASRNVTRGL